MAVSVIGLVIVVGAMLLLITLLVVGFSNFKKK